jgi:hypothetical protein
MSWFGDVFDFESFKLGNMWDKYRQDPERAFLGINTPFESKVWGGITGKNYTPTVDMYGGATPDDVQKARQAGINTGPGQSMHGIARTIASMYAGGAAGKAFGGFGGAQAGGSGLNGGLLGETAASNGTGLTMGGSGMGMSGGMGSGISGSVATPAASSPGLLATISEYAKPVGNVLNAASSAKSLMSTPERPITPSPLMTPMPNSSLGQMVSGMQQDQANRMAMDQKNRQMRRQMIRGGLL